MFKEYESKPITRLAHKIIEEDMINKVEGKESIYVCQSGMEFKAYETIKTGDYIVYLNETDIYHCSAKVFAERNIISEDET